KGPRAPIHGRTPSGAHRGGSRAHGRGTRRRRGDALSLALRDRTQHSERRERLPLVFAGHVVHRGDHDDQPGGDGDGHAQRGSDQHSHSDQHSQHWHDHRRGPHGGPRHDHRHGHGHHQHGGTDGHHWRDSRTNRHHHGRSYRDRDGQHHFDGQHHRD